jgi:hypothetical protein
VSHNNVIIYKHELHCAAPELDQLPSVQGMQDEDPTIEYVPAEQLVQETVEVAAFTVDQVPALQPIQVVAPATEDRVPTVQF